MMQALDYRLVSALIQELPRNGAWSRDRRDQWMEAFARAVDLLVDIKEEGSENEARSGEA